MNFLMTFGLGSANKAVVEVLWPGGVRNRLYDVKAGASVTFPEIPCSFDDDWASTKAYLDCVKPALDDLVAAGVLAENQKGRLLAGALRAFKSD